MMMMMMMMVFMVMGGRIICLCVALLVMAIGIVRHTHSVSVGDPFDPHFFYFSCKLYKRITTPRRREALTVDRRLKAQREISRSIKSPLHHISPLAFFFLCTLKCWEMDGLGEREKTLINLTQTSKKGKHILYSSTTVSSSDGSCSVVYMLVGCWYITWQARQSGHHTTDGLTSVGLHISN
jgi:hypothetical protein